MKRCQTCKGETFVYKHVRRKNGDSRRYVMPCPDCQGEEGWDLTTHIVAVPGRCGGCPTMRRSRFRPADLAHHESFAEFHADHFKHPYIPEAAFEEARRLYPLVPTTFWESAYDPTDPQLRAWARRLEEACR